MASTTWTPLKKAILEAAIRQLARSGEASLRVDRIAREAGCSAALLYRHFESREGLLEAAMVERLRREAAAITKDLLRAVEQSRDTGDFVRMDVAISRETHGRHRARNRAIIAEVLAASRTRPALRKEFLQQQREVQRALAELVGAGQAKGIFRADVSAEAIAEFVRAYTFGRALMDADPDSVDRLEEWVRIVAIFVESLRPAPGGAPAQKRVRRETSAAPVKKAEVGPPRSRRVPKTR